MAGKWMSSPLLIDGHARQVDDLRTGSNDDILGADSLIVAIKPSNLHLCRGLKASPAFGVGDLHTMRCGRSTIQACLQEVQNPSKAETFAATLD